MSDLMVELERIKQDVRSLLISAPNGLTPKMLESDFAIMNGKSLPYQKFGYSNCLDFLRSINDVVQVKGTHNHIMLYGVADESTAHILKLVKNQKRTKFYSGFRSSNATSSKKKLQSVNNALCPSAYTRSTVFQVLKKYPNGFSLTKLPEYYENVNGIKLDIDGTVAIPSLILSMPDIAKLDYGKKEKNGNNLYIFPASNSGFSKNQVPIKSNACEDFLHDKCNTPDSKMSNTVTSSAKQNMSTSSNNKLIKNTSCVNTNKTVCSNSTPGPSTNTSKTKEKLVKITKSSSTISLKPFQSNESAGVLSYISDSTTYDTDNENSMHLKTVSGNSTTKSFLFEDSTPPSSILLKNEILDLLNEQKAAIRSIKIGSLYKKKYAKELNLHKHGYYSIIELLSSMSDKINICRIHRTGEWIIKSRGNVSRTVKETEYIQDHDRTALKQTLEKEFEKLVNCYKGGIAVASLEDLYEMHFERQLPLRKMNCNSVADLLCQITDTVDIQNNKLCLQPSSICDALRKSEQINRVAPSDAIGIGVHYKPALLPSADWGFFRCFVSYVNTPSDFRIQVISEETTEPFAKMESEMNKTYCHPQAKVYKIPPYMIKPGLICVAIFHAENTWNRAVIQDLPEGGFVLVKYVDFGDTASVSIGTIFFLKQEFYSLPVLEVHARLANIKPVADKWDIAAKKLLLEFTQNKELQAKVTGEEEREGHKVFSLVLCDTSTFEDTYVVDMLLQKRLAVTQEYEDLSAEEISHLFWQRENTDKQTKHKKSTDFPNESPPPYQASDSMPPLVCASSNNTKKPTVPSHLCSTVSAKTNPPPGFANVVPQNQCTIDELLKKFKNANFSTVETVEVDSKSIKLTNKTIRSENTFSNSKPREQKKFVKEFRLTDKLNIHVINFDSTALILSGEIALIFGLESEDMLVPFLMMKDVHEKFPDLILPNNQHSEKLFFELNKLNIKGAFKSNGSLKSVLTLYRLSDIPDMIYELCHNDQVFLNQRLKEISSCFDPENNYWYREANESLGSSVRVSSSSVNEKRANIENSNLTRPSTSMYRTVMQSKPLIVECNQELNTASKEELTRKRDDLLKQLVDVANPSSRLLSELKHVMSQISEIDEQRESMTHDPPIRNETPFQLNFCEIPIPNENISIKKIFSSDSVKSGKVPIRGSF